MNFKDPYIKLVGKYDGRMDAWHLSKPNIDPNDPVLNNISKVDLPVHGFATYHFEIGSSILLRDILFLVRPSQEWARSNRITLIDEDNLFYDSMFDDIEYLANQEVIEAHKKSVDTSVNQDNRKSNFLYSTYCYYSWMVDGRTLASLIKSLNNTVLYKYAEMFQEILDAEGIDLGPSSHELLKDYMVIRPNSESDEVIVSSYPELDLISIDALMVGSLASQFERQAYSVVKSELVNMIYDKRSIFDLPKSQSNLIWMSSTLNKSKAIKMVKTRSCWFAQFDKESMASWSRIIVGIINALELDPNDILLCNGDHHKCRFFNEQLARLNAGNNKKGEGDLNPPCPIMTGIPEMYKIRGRKYDSDSEIYKKWESIINKLDLKLNQYGIEYLNNVFNYGYQEKSDNEKMADLTNEIMNKYKEYLKDESQGK